MTILYVFEKTRTVQILGARSEHGQNASMPGACRARPRASKALSKRRRRTVVARTPAPRARRTATARLPRANAGDLNRHEKPARAGPAKQRLKVELHNTQTDIGRQRDRRRTPKNLPVRAVAVFNQGNVRGRVYFTEEPANSRVRIDVSLSGLQPRSLHGLHVHEYGDMSDSCESMCAHFNPFGNTHGRPGMKERHVGDLGNLKTDAAGQAKYAFYDNVIGLRGTTTNIIGRGLIVHADEDDCGQGGQLDSLTTGHAGKRIACAVIGFAPFQTK